MRLNDSASNSSRATRQISNRDRISVSRLVNEIVLSLSDRFTDSQITVELDVQQLDVFANVELIRAALKSLMRNALESMAGGGELSVTLIDSPHQWELEVADTSTNRLVEASIQKNQTETQDKRQEAVAFPTSESALKRDSLAEVHEAAAAHGGHVQTWDCPSGGTANVLIIPKRHRNAA